MSSQHSERRDRKRRALSLYLPFVNSRTGEPVGNLADLSPGGFMLESTKPVLLNVEFSFHVELPPEVAGQTSLILTARSLWSRRDPVDTRLYDTGFEITQMHPGDVKTLDLLFQRFGRTQPGGD
jgi:hypothetical protein